MFVSVKARAGASVVAMRYRIPVRSITLFIFGGGLIGAEPPSAIAEFWIALCRPAILLSDFFGLLQPMVGAFAPLLASKYLAYINGSLAF
jgi:Zn-dependent protease